MTRLKIGVVTALVLTTLISPLKAQTNNSGLLPGPTYSLDQFGPVGTGAEAEKTLQKATDAVMAAGGGIITIPTQTAPGWIPKNNSQHLVRTPPAPASAKAWRNGVGVSIVDARGATPRIYPPQASGLEIDRIMNVQKGESLPFWGYYPVLTLRNNVLHGSTSYRDYLMADAPAGKDTKFYLATVRGVFPGMFMSIDEYGQVERLYIKALGYDKEKNMWYFTADSDYFHPKNAIMGNKDHVSVLDMSTESHNENQTFDVRMWRQNYSQGDNYLFDARFKYMGDVHSTAGDENGVIYAAFVESMTGIFRGQVESWSSTNNELVYKGGDGGTLGSGRPIINLNPAKWITNGSVIVVQPGTWTEVNEMMQNPVFEGKAYPTTVGKGKQGFPVLIMGGMIRFSADAAITDDVVGRYFAVDEPTEYVPNGATVRRWYLIDSVTKNPDGTKEIKIIRHWWGAKAMNSPRLYKPENTTYDGHIRPLKYIIAPGANAYDVSDGVNSPKRTIRIVPTSFTGTSADFAANDPIEQAIGPDPFKPIPFRSWMWDQVPGAFPSPVFDIANNGSVMRDTMLYVHGNGGNIEKDKVSHYDGNPPWDRFLTFETSCNTGIKFAGDVGNAAILFAQPNNRVQPIKWYYGTESNTAPKVASLTVSRETGDFNFSGGLVTAAGLSGGDKPSRNLRGKNIGVKAGATTVPITFPVAEVDGDYAVFVEQSWIGNRAIVKKDGSGFTVEFEKPAPENAKLDWMIVR